MADELQIGMIVEVTDSACVHYKREGMVVGFDESDQSSPVRVWFDRASDHLLNLNWIERTHLSIEFEIKPPPPDKQAQDGRTWNYAPNELTPRPYWSMPTLADRYFQDMYHHYHPITSTFVKGARDCDVAGCKNASAQRIIFNVWGTVSYADVCDRCANLYHQKIGEFFPWKDRLTNQTA